MSGEDILIALCGIVEEQAEIIRELSTKLSLLNAYDEADEEAVRSAEEAYEQLIWGGECTGLKSSIHSDHSEKEKKL